MSFFRSADFFCDTLLEDHRLPFHPFSFSSLRSHHLLIPPPPLEEKPLALSLLDLFDPIPNSFPLFSDVIEFRRTPFSSSVRRSAREYYPSSPLPSYASTSITCSHGLETEPMLRHLNDRVSALELGLEELLATDPRLLLKGKGRGDVSYSYKLESEGGTGAGSKHKWEAEIRGLDGHESKIAARYKLEKTPGKKEEHKKEKPRTVRIVEIEEPDRNPVIPRNQELVGKRKTVIFKSRGSKGKKKELSPVDAALLIQANFRAYLVRRSQTLRGLRDLAVAKAKFKELRCLFNNFSYRRRLTVDAEERQRFSEKIIVLILTVEDIVASDSMIREVRRTMIVDLEAMLDVVDPHPTGKRASFRRKFDLPEQPSNAALKAMAQGVAEVVQILDQNGVREELHEVSF